MLFQILLPFDTAGRQAYVASEPVDAHSRR